MANREKKISLGRKQASASPVPSKDTLTNQDTLPATNDDAPKLTPVKTPKLAKKVKRPAAKKVVKKTLKINFKAKNKIAKPKKKLIKGLEMKKTLKSIKKGLNKKRAKVAEQDDDGPPVLEPIFPIAIDKKPKKRAKKEEEGISDIPEVASKAATKARVFKKPKIDSVTETIEDVMNDLKCLIKSEEVKQDAEDCSKMETKKKLPTKKQKMDLLKKKTIKKGNIENTLNKLDSSDSKLIDMLDLNVRKVKKLPSKIRRHSIEKFALERNEKVQNIAIFGNLPRSISPRAKRSTKLRQSIDIINAKRCSPYTTRSDSPARILRNGKHRKLKDMNLLDGLDIQFRRRRRLCSDYSGSEISVSKFSGYESDSSFSDFASLACVENAEKDSDAVKIEIKKEVLDTLNNSNQQENLNIKSLPAVIKKSPSTETAPNGVLESNFMDPNMCPDVKQEPKLDLKVPNPLYNPAIPSDSFNGNPSSKVPEKSIILDIMKHKFNEIYGVDEKDSDKRSTRSDAKKVVVAETKDDNISAAKFYGTSSTCEAASSNISVPEEVICEETVIVPEEPQQDIPIEIQQIVAIENKSDETVQIQLELEESSESLEVLEISEPEIQPKELAPIESQEPILELEEAAVEPQLPLAEPQESELVLDTIQMNPEPDNTLEESNREVIDVIETAELSQASDQHPQEAVQEDLAVKEHIFQALGLQSLQAAEEAKQKQKEKVVQKNDNYTGTLKTIIKLNRPEKKKGRNSVKMTLQKTKKAGCSKDPEDAKSEEDVYKVMKENASSNWKSGAQSSDTAGAPRKSHYSNRSNMDGSSEHTSDGDTNGGEDGSGKLLVIPEKASSFSIHPGRLCKDECSYCFGKFGLFDTPCHIAQLKSLERQEKILSTEKHLTCDSCLCDACYRHVDRKSNTPSYTNKAYKRNTLVAPGPKQNHCHVLNCGQLATNILRRKWIMKMRKNICDVVNIDLDNPGLHSIPICEEHYIALEHLMVCAMCKRRLARNHVHYLGSETTDLSKVLNDMGIPVKLGDKPVVCKLCRYFATLAMKQLEDRPESSIDFVNEYKKRLLHFHNVEPMDQAEAEEPIPFPTKEKDQLKKKKKPKNLQSNETAPQSETENLSDQTRVPSIDSRPESPSDFMVDYNTLVPNVALECSNEADGLKREPPMKPPIVLKKIIKPESVKEAVEISKSIKLKNKSDIAVQRLGSNPSISVRQLFPGEEEIPLLANIEFGNMKERTPEGWEKCSSTIQYDVETKQLWHELQKPYGNQSSFLRHLILLEKYFRNGDLVLSANASNNSINYSESVQNRLKAYDNIPSSAGPTQPLTMLAFNKTQRGCSGIIGNKEISPLTVVNAANIPKSTPITLTQINPSIVSTPKQKPPGLPPGLISLQPGTNKPVAPLQKVAQPQKIKFPITKNWRPNLIPIDPAKKKVDQKTGLVQVISGGKPYHITLEDYKKMCAIKRTFDLRQKRIQEAHQKSHVIQNTQSLLKTMTPKKGLIITKTATVTTPRNDLCITEPETDNCAERIEKHVERFENHVERFEKHVERLSEPKSLLVLPKIPKSLTVIPQSVPRKPSRPTSPVLLITPKPSTSKS